MEFNADYMNGTSVPDWLCGGSIDKWNYPTWEVAYNHYHGRQGISLPNTREFINRIRPTGAKYHMAWETITHAEVGSPATSSRMGRTAVPGAKAPKAIIRRIVLIGQGVRSGIVVATRDSRGNVRYVSPNGSLVSRDDR